MPWDDKQYIVKANEFQFSFTREEIDTADVASLSAELFHLIRDHRSCNAKLLATDATGKKLKIEIEGETFDVEIKDELDQVLEQMGFAKANIQQVKDIKAPMPGLVVDIAVSEGQEVSAGDKLLILEAMKMENSIIIHTGAIIKKVLVSAGQAVEKGQVLVELE